MNTTDTRESKVLADGGQILRTSRTPGEAEGRLRSLVEAVFGTQAYTTVNWNGPRMALVQPVGQRSSITILA